MPRVFADWLSRKWGQPVVIENRTGAAGNIGAEAVVKSEPDGYTLLSAPPPPLVINHNLYPKLGFDPTEFVPIIIMGRVPNALVVNPKVAAKNGRRADRLCRGQSRQAHLRHAGQRHDLASDLRNVPADGEGEVPARALSRLGAGAERSGRRQRRHHVRQSRRLARAGERRQAQAAGGGDAQAHGVAAGRADDRRDAAGLRIGGVVRGRGAAQDAARRSSTRSTPT